MFFFLPPVFVINVWLEHDKEKINARENVMWKTNSKVTAYSHLDKKKTYYEMMTCQIYSNALMANKRTRAHITAAIANRGWE